MELSAGLVRGTKDVLQHTTSEKASEDAIRLNGRLVQATSIDTTTRLSLRDSSGTQCKGKGSKNSGEVHGDFSKVK